MFLTGGKSSGQIGTIIWRSLHADVLRLSRRGDGKYLACSSMVCSSGSVNEVKPSINKLALNDCKS